MGDFFTVDGFTRSLLETFIRLKLCQDPYSTVLDASFYGVGHPDQLLLSPDALKAFQKAFEK